MRHERETRSKKFGRDYKLVIFGPLPTYLPSYLPALPTHFIWLRSFERPPFPGDYRGYWFCGNWLALITNRRRQFWTTNDSGWRPRRHDIRFGVLLHRCMRLPMPWYVSTYAFICPNLYIDIYLPRYASTCFNLCLYQRLYLSQPMPLPTPLSVSTYASDHTFICPNLCLYLSLPKLLSVPTYVYTHAFICPNLCLYPCLYLSQLMPIPMPLSVPTYASICLYLNFSLSQPMPRTTTSWNVVRQTNTTLPSSLSVSLWHTRGDSFSLSLSLSLFLSLSLSFYLSIAPSFV